MSTVRTIYAAPTSTTEQSSESIPKQEILLRLRKLLPHREDIVVAGREIKGGIVIHPIIATAILGVVVTIGLGIRSEMNWQHDQIIIIATQKADAADQLRVEKAERASEKALRESTDEAWRTNIKVDIAKLAEQLKTSEERN